MKLEAVLSLGIASKKAAAHEIPDVSDVRVHKEKF